MADGAGGCLCLRAVGAAFAAVIKINVTIRQTLSLLALGFVDVGLFSSALFLYFAAGAGDFVEEVRTLKRRVRRGGCQGFRPPSCSS